MSEGNSDNFYSFFAFADWPNGFTVQYQAVGNADPPQYLEGSESHAYGANISSWHHNTNLPHDLGRQRNRIRCETF